MDDKEFLRARKILEKTQKQLAELLGSSIKAVHSYEQGWAVEKREQKRVGQSRNARRNAKHNARPGNFRPAGFAGLLTAPSVKERCSRIGRKK
jgi:DNA-binding XRE family transcriptional regulator